LIKERNYFTATAGGLFHPSQLVEADRDQKVWICHSFSEEVFPRP
jgi:hypothetical protein